jgi:Protein of unknown function (DUF3300)
MTARLIDRVIVCVVALTLAVPPLVPAQTAPPPAPFKAEELDQLAAPIALYPDPLVAQVLMASTYPLEIVQAARFVKENPGVTGEPLAQALQGQTWDDSVKSLTTFPQVLSMMDGKLDWTQKLGDAFLAQQKELMEAIQRLRAKAQASGNLKSTAEQTVTVQPAAEAAPAPPPPPAPGQPAPAPQQVPQQVIVQQAPPTVITIAPTNPQVVYVPTYNPTVVYGAWPYPAYPPYSYYPPGYVAGVGLFSFAAGVAVGGALWGNCNWGSGDVDINANQYNSYSKNVNKTDIANKRTERQGNRENWQHNPENRRGAQYRDSATQQRYNRGDNPQATQARESFRGRAEQGRQDISRGGGASGFQPSAQPRQQGGQRGDGPGGGSGVGQRQAGAGQQPARRPDAGASQTRGAGSGGGSAFQGMGQGREAQNFSNRGQSSRQSSMSSAGASRAQSRPSAAPSGGARGGGGGRGGGRR